MFPQSQRHFHCEFLSTPSARRATVDGSTRYADLTDFYPRPPRGGRLVSCAVEWVKLQISIHALREEGDLLIWTP